MLEALRAVGLTCDCSLGSPGKFHLRITRIICLGGSHCVPCFKKTLAGNQPFGVTCFETETAPTAHMRTPLSWRQVKLHITSPANSAQTEDYGLTAAPQTGCQLSCPPADQHGNKNVGTQKGVSSKSMPFQVSWRLAIGVAAC